MESWIHFMLIETGVKIMHYLQKCSAVMGSRDCFMQGRCTGGSGVFSLCLPIPCQSQPPSHYQSRWFGLLLNQSGQCSSQPE